jgi:calcium/calmodulin-dependent protein kinase (CaM kinase) II
MADSTVESLLSLNQRLLTSIATGDWDVYQRLCDPELTAFEPEAKGHLVEGLEFHRFYFDLRHSKPQNTTMVSPKVRLFGDTAVITYVRLVQRVDEQQRPFTVAFEETRIWHKQADGWRHVHFHRSHNSQI